MMIHGALLVWQSGPLYMLIKLHFWGSQTMVFAHTFMQYNLSNFIINGGNLFF